MLVSPATRSGGRDATHWTPWVKVAIGAALLLAALASPGLAASIATGGHHTCALTSTGGVKCWGYNALGQLGDGTRTRAVVPIDVSGLASGVTAIALGGFHTCALTSAGAVKCWGHNLYGQLGDGTQMDRLTAVVASGLTSGVTAIAAGHRHTCVLTSAGGVKCWGNNNVGQLGDDTTMDRSTPVDVVGLTSGVTQIAAGGSHTCALTSAGPVRCWGNNLSGMLGDGTTTNRLTPVGVSGLASGVTAVATGAFHTCALTSGGGVKCWGSNSDGRLGDGTTTFRVTPVNVSGLEDGVNAIVAGGAQTCALTSASGVECWGSNDDGQLGDGTTTDRLTPVDVDGLNGVGEIATGDRHACALTIGGAIKCWGNNEAGQLGDGTAIPRLTAVGAIGLESGVVAIAAGGYHACALTMAGAVKCWGEDHFGQRGDGTAADRVTPVDVSGLESGVAAIATGNLHACALTGAGGVKCWGWNNTGQLGDGTSGNLRPSPVDVTSLASGATAIATGGDHSCALTSADGVECWGLNAFGELGDGTTTDRTTPVELSVLASGAIATGRYHTCALTETGGVKCWGRNEWGQLGDGTTTDRVTPVDVNGLASGVSAITAGEDHSCALTAGGGVKCWGRNEWGQLGDGTTTDRLVPVDASGLATGVVAMSAGYGHTCVLTSAGGAKCWGANIQGEVGDGTTSPRSTAVDVNGLASGVIGIAAGGNHSCALSSAGAVMCWGSNRFGQIGNGEAGYSALPTKVVGFEGVDSVCGNGLVEVGEGCDDGDAVDTGCCSAACQLQNAANDADADGICDGADVCPSAYNPDQRDSDTIGGGDLCDACPADPTDRCVASKTEAATITPDGGMLEVPDQSLLIDFPPGAVDSPTSVSATGGLTESGFGLKLLPDKTPLAFQLEPSGKTFDPPVALTFRWQDANDNCFVDNPAATCPVESRTECTTTRNPACDLPVREEDLQIFRDGQVHPRPGTTCASDAIGCDREANEWTVATDSFSEWVVGEATCGVVKKRKLTLRQLGRPRGDETLRLRGQINLDVPLDPGPIDPVGHGLTLVVETAQGAVLYAARLVEAYDALTETGWKKRPSKQLWTYASRPGAAEDVTATVSVAGAKGQRVKLDVTVAGLRLATLKKKHLPLSAQVFLDGRCGNATFAGPAPAPVCALSPDQTTLECR